MLALRGMRFPLSTCDIEGSIGDLISFAVAALLCNKLRTFATKQIRLKSTCARPRRADY
jgi:hypothetical protein